MFDFSQPPGSSSREERKTELLELTAREFTLYQFVPIREPDQPDVNSKWRGPIGYLKDGQEAFWLRDSYPDPELVRELFVEGRLILSVKPHRSNRHVKIRLWTSSMTEVPGT